jgi:ribosome modulation factor
MRSQKRSPTDRAYSRGYQAAMSGRSWSSCPHDAGAARIVWMNGWREGREDHWNGMDTRSQLQKLVSF